LAWRCFDDLRQSFLESPELWPFMLIIPHCADKRGGGIVDRNPLVRLQLAMESEQDVFARGIGWQRSDGQCGISWRTGWNEAGAG
jgi:hypothetical protein